jgi:DNA-binding response OmpR family regulator
MTVTLSDKEFALFVYVLRNAKNGKPADRLQAFTELYWQRTDGPSLHVINVMICHIRPKIAPLGLTLHSRQERIQLVCLGPAPGTTRIELPEFWVNPQYQTVNIQGLVFPLPEHQFKIMEVLTNNRLAAKTRELGELTHQDEMCVAVYGNASTDSHNAMYLSLHRLRAKMKGTGIKIRTHNRRFYRLEPE